MVCNLKEIDTILYVVAVIYFDFAVKVAKLVKAIPIYLSWSQKLHNQASGILS